MKRFYRASICALDKMELIEIKMDIANYVNYLELKNAMLISHIRSLNTPQSEQLLKKMGYDI